VISSPRIAALVLQSELGLPVPFPVSTRYLRADPVEVSAIIGSHKYTITEPRMVAMTNQELDDPTNDDDVLGESMDDAADYRERAAAKIDQIAQQTKQMLAEAGIDIPVFFLIPSSGDSVLIFGTPANPCDDLWTRVAEIVAPIVRQLVGLAGTRCRAMACATIQDQECCDAAT
jgi:hypothetical protein